MKYCSNCGQPFDDGTKFCPHCGAQVEGPATPQFSNPNEGMQRASAEAGEVELSSWKNPNPKPQPQQTPPQGGFSETQRGGYYPQGSFNQSQRGGYQPQGNFNQSQRGSYQPQDSYNQPQPQGGGSRPQREPAYSSSPVDSIKANNDHPEKKKRGKGCLRAIMIAIGVLFLLYILTNLF